MDENTGGNAETMNTSVNGGEGTPTAVSDDPVVRAEARAAEYLDLLQRERASFVNYRRRAEQERAESQQYATAQLLKKLLPVVDDFDRALTAAPAGQPWVDGVRMIDRKLHTLLEQEGVTPIESLGQPFDPALHEAIAYENEGTGEDVVAAEFARGYRHRDKVLRHAMVKVGKRRPDEQAAPPASAPGGSAPS